jgi:hypothetical protein
VRHKSLANISVDLSQAELNLSLGQKQFASSVGTLEQVQFVSRQQLLYLDAFLQPTYPDSSEYPKRGLWIAGHRCSELAALGSPAWHVIQAADPSGSIEKATNASNKSIQTHQHDLCPATEAQCDEGRYVAGYAHSVFQSRSWLSRCGLVATFAHMLILITIYTVANRTTPFGESMRVFFLTGLIPTLTFMYVSRFMSLSARLEPANACVSRSYGD